MIYLLLFVIVCLVIMFVGWIFKKYKAYKEEYKANNLVRPKFKFARKKKEKKTIEVKNIQLTLIEPFMQRKELLFWKYLNTILPTGYIAVPKVGLNTLVLPDGNKTVFNQIADKCLDFVVFTEGNMQPKLIIDVYDKSYLDRSIVEQEPFLLDVLNKLGVQVIEILVAENFDREEAKKKIYQQLDVEIRKD